MIKLENAGLRAPLKISLGSRLHSQKGIRAPVSKNDRAPGSTAEISGLQGSRDPPFGTLICNLTLLIEAAMDPQCVAE